jgi:signal transduction histidine kinase
MNHRECDQYLVSFNDITRLKEMEEQVRIQDKMTTLGRISSELAHEVRNPLSVINLNTNSLMELMDAGIDPAIAGQMLEKIRKASGTIEKTIKRILAVSKSRKAEFILSDINAPIREAVDLCSDIFSRRHIETELDLTDNLPLCHIDPDLMQQVIINLLSNAVDALQQQDSPKIIRISSVHEDDSNVIRIADSGPGILPEIRERIFDPFYSTKSEGTGIGLSLCQRLIHRHNGKITINESEWGGSEFSVILPSAGKRKKI